MSEWSTRDDRQAVARAEYEHIMTTSQPGSEWRFHRGRRRRVCVRRDVAPRGPHSQRPAVDHAHVCRRGWCDHPDRNPRVRSAQERRHLVLRVRRIRTAFRHSSRLAQGVCHADVRNGEHVQNRRGNRRAAGDPGLRILDRTHRGQRPTTTRYRRLSTKSTARHHQPRRLRFKVAPASITCTARSGVAKSTSLAATDESSASAAPRRPLSMKR